MISQQRHKRWRHVFRALVQSQMWLCLMTLLSCSNTLLRLSCRARGPIRSSEYQLIHTQTWGMKKSFSQMSELGGVGGGGEMSQTFCVIIIKQNIKMQFFSRITPPPAATAKVRASKQPFNRCVSVIFQQLSQQRLDFCRPSTGPRPQGYLVLNLRGAIRQRAARTLSLNENV